MLDAILARRSAVERGERAPVGRGEEGAPALMIREFEIAL
jgi:hypothetical protein